MFNKTVICLFMAVVAQLFTAISYCDQTAEEAFTNIYINRAWGTNNNGEGTSGSGSLRRNTVLYRSLLQDFMQLYDIQTIVDLGCGDWEFSRTIDWGGRLYLGYDVVKFVIERNTQKFASPNIHFFHADGLSTEFPHADLLICKDVLQHLSIADINRLIPQFKKFKYSLITNDIDPGTGTSSNVDIPKGGYRTVDLTAPPFNLTGTKILTYQADEVTKQVLLIKPSDWE